jgi:hypothetical protein
MEPSNTRGMESSMEKGKAIRKGRYSHTLQDLSFLNTHRQHQPPTPELSENTHI